MKYEWKIFEVNSSLWDDSPKIYEKAVVQAMEYENMGWEIVGVQRFYGLVIVARRPRKGNL